MNHGMNTRDPLEARMKTVSFDPSLYVVVPRARIHEIAQETHMLGRLYATGGEKANPADQFERIRALTDRWIDVTPHLPEQPQGEPDFMTANVRWVGSDVGQYVPAGAAAPATASDVPRWTQEMIDEVHRDATEIAAKGRAGKQVEDQEVTRASVPDEPQPAVREGALATSGPDTVAHPASGPDGKP